MAGTIAYKKDLFDFINNLTSINNAIAFERVDDRVVVRKSDKNRTLPYIVSVPAEYFDIEETIAFYKYDDFYKNFCSIKDATLDRNGNKIVIASGKENIKYTLSDEEGIINGPKKIDFDAWDATFTITKEDLDKMVRINSNVKGNRVHITCEGTVVTMKFYANGSENSYSKEFVCERVSDSNRSFDFTILSNRFESLPSKRDYSMDISSKNFVRISLIHDEIEFNLYSGDVS